MAKGIEIKQFVGAVNFDDPAEVLGRGFVMDARGIVWEGVPPNRRARVVNGNSVVFNSLLPTTGVNKTICQKYDHKTKRLYFLNYNSAGSHGIYLFNTTSSTFQRLIEVGVNTIGDPLSFTGESHSNINVLYGDDSQGDILYWLDSLGRPSKININRAISNGYGQIQRSFLDVAKEPSYMPPVVVYEYDATNTVNGLRKKLFRFKIRWVFDDMDKSVTSSQSEMPLPWDSFNQSYDSNPSANCRIAITYQTGPSNVKKIEVLAAVSIGNVIGDFFLIESIDKSVSGIPDNDIATTLFYNNKGYNNIDITESTQLYDYVPLSSLAQTLLNGNVLSYGNITEGYPNLTDFTFGGNESVITLSYTGSYAGNTFSKLIVNQSGDNTVGFGYIHIVVRGLIMSSGPSYDTYYVYMVDGTNVSYTVSTGDDAAAVISGLRNDAISKGYTIISSGDNDLIIERLNTFLAGFYVISDYSYVASSSSSLAAYDWLGSHGFGIVYFDEKGRTNGVVYDKGFSVSSPSYSETGSYSNKPILTSYIYHIPPEWAHYYHWVRTKDLKKSSFIQWISDRTFKDNAVVPGAVRYAYISIESLNAFIASNKGTPLKYGFSSGDRITFIKRYNVDNSTANIYGNSRDYEIISSETNPTINGQIRTGQFIKIILPSTDGGFDFGDGFNNYFIELYTPAQSVENGLDLYYEFGEEYSVVNPGQSNRCHEGKLNNQAPDYSSPAITQFINGDFYIKNRSIQTGNVFTFRINSGGGEADRVLIGATFVSQTYDDPNITTQSVPLTGLTPAFNPGSDGRWLVRAINWTNFKVKGTINIQFPDAKPGDFWQIFLQNRYGEINFLVPAFDAGNAGVYSFPIDGEITLEDDRFFLEASSIGFGSRKVSFLASELTFTVDRIIPQSMIDPNFSDFFPSSVNSNGRGWVYDENAAQVAYQDMYRWSLDYQKDTTINQTCRFYPVNFDTVDRSHGGIMKMDTMDHQLIFFQERKIGHTGIYQKFISDSAGSSQLVTTNSIIATNNVQYYSGEIGVGNQPTSVVTSDYVFYGVDPVKNIIWRLSRDGVTDLTETYKVKTWAFQNIPKYLNPGNYPYGGKQKILGTYNIRGTNVGEYLLLAQGAASAGETFAFEERYNSFTSLYDVDCDCIACAENVLYYFKNGAMYKQNTLTSGYNVFFGTQYTASLLIPFNDKMTDKKVFMGLAYQSKFPWGSNTDGDIQTDTVNSQTNLTQQSKIMVQDYNVLEAPNMYAAFNRDSNSMANSALALWEGDYLVGHYILVRLRHSSNGANYIFAPYIVYSSDPRNY